MAAASRKVSLKLLIDTTNHRVLFAETGKEFVDFLLSILALPVATLIGLLKKQSMVGCLANVYESVETLGHNYLQKNLDIFSVLNPRYTPPVPTTAGPPLLLLDDCPPAPASRKFYSCRNTSYNHWYVAEDPRSKCPNCGSEMSREIPYVVPPPPPPSAAGEDGGGYVKGVVTYMVTDDLAVTPISTISSITLLKKFNVTDVGRLEERVVDLDTVAGLKLLSAALRCQTVLTNVFLKG